MREGSTGTRPAPLASLPLFFTIEVAPVIPTGFAISTGATFIDDTDCAFINEDIGTARVATLDDALVVIRRHLDRNGHARPGL